MKFLVVVLLSCAALGQNAPSTTGSSAPQGKEFILIRPDAPVIDTVAQCDSKIVFGKMSKLIREIFPTECGAEPKESGVLDQLGNGKGPPASSAREEKR